MKMDKKAYEKIKSMTISHDDFMQEQLQNVDFQYEWLKHSIEEYIKDGDFAVFYRALERVVKARTSISRLAKDLNMDRSNLSEILNGKKEPKMQTTIKILNALGYELTLSQKVG